MENITENNKIIAEFMDCLTVDMNGVIKEDINSLKYHKDWHWLMPVVTKIKSLSTLKEIGILFYQEWEQVINDKLLTLKIEALYVVCIEFIKWYNKQNSPA